MLWNKMEINATKHAHICPDMVENTMKFIDVFSSLNRLINMTLQSDPSIKAEKLWSYVNIKIIHDFTRKYKRKKYI